MELKYFAQSTVTVQTHQLTLMTFHSQQMLAGFASLQHSVIKDTSKSVYISLSPSLFLSICPYLLNNFAFEPAQY